MSEYTRRVRAVMTEMEQDGWRYVPATDDSEYGRLYRAELCARLCGAIICPPPSRRLK